jgi:anaerobic magnesium-protoporphyrin IX monomethyl ester cyclase
MKKILFVNPHYPYDPYTLLLHPPLCYGYIGARLKSAGHEVYHADLPLVGNTVTALEPFLESIQPDVIGITCVAQSYCQALEIARFAKDWRKSVVVAMGGPHVTFIPIEVLERHDTVDYVLLFDAEDSFLELVDALDQSAYPAQLAHILGLAYRRDDGIEVTPPADAIRALDHYPRPDRSLFDMKQYLAHDYETVVVTARGCPSRCTFCSTTLIGRRYRWHSVPFVCDELEEVLGMGFTSVFFGDDTFSGHGRRVIEFCDEVRRRGLEFAWTSNMRAIDARPPVLEAICSAGGYRVFMGFESIQASTLKLVRKGTTPEKLYKTAELVKSYGLELHASFIIGAPGDTHESLQATLDFIRLVNPTVATFNVMEPRPGTDVYANPLAYGIHIPDPYWYETSSWVDSPVCYLDTLTSSEIRSWVERCYDEFCSPEFRSPEVMHALRSITHDWDQSVDASQVIDAPKHLNAAIPLLAV